MEKFGFVYIWRDKKHNRYYIGSHWGTFDDKYVCSSNWMRDAYKRRPQDFKRRILSIATSRREMIDKENMWLKLIKVEEIKVRYYNLRIHEFNHWVINEDTSKTTRQKISERTKAAMQRPEVIAAYKKGCETRDTIQTPETREKRRVSMKKTMAEKYPVDDRKTWTPFNSEEYKTSMAKSVGESWKYRDKVAIGSKISESLKASKHLRSETIKKLKWWNNGVINRRTETLPDVNWVGGRV